MPVDFSRHDDLPGSNPAISEFGTLPIYDRARRKKRSALKTSAAPRATAAASAPEAGEFTARRAARSGAGGVPTWALAAVPAAIVLAGGAFVLMQPRETAEPPMTVAAMDTTAPPLATTPAAPEFAPAAEATSGPVNPAPLPAATTPARAERPAEPARVARARPAPRAPAAEEFSMDASTVAPTYSPPAAAQPNPLAVNPAPLVVPTPAQPSTTTDMVPPAEMSGTTQEAVPDASAIPQ